MTDSAADKQFLTNLMQSLQNRPSESELPAMPLDSYQSIMEAFTPPTTEQIIAFVEYVARAKSWYKHLDLLPPGKRFRFFVDPNAGLDRVLDDEGACYLINRTEASPQGHYSWMPTADYWSKFGRLGFSCAAGTRIALPVSLKLGNGDMLRGLLDNRVDCAILQLDRKVRYQFPAEVLSAGSVDLSGVIHPHSSHIDLWRDLVDGHSTPFSWPEASGGKHVAEKIRQLCQNTEVDQEILDKELDALLEPERKRQKISMIGAIQSVVEMAYPKAR